MFTLYFLEIFIVFKKISLFLTGGFNENIFEYETPSTANHSNKDILNG